MENPPSSLDSEMINQELVSQTPFQIEQAKPVKWLQKLGLIYRAPEVRKLPGVGYRIVANAAILVPDSMPSYLGIPAPFMADGLKWLRWYCKLKGVDPKPLDLTPDVDKYLAIGTSSVLEPIQAVTHAPIPSHAAEASIQLIHDFNKVKRAWRKVKTIASLQTVADLRNYQTDELVKTIKPPMPTYPYFPPDATPQELIEKYIPKPDF